MVGYVKMIGTKRKISRKEKPVKEEKARTDIQKLGGGSGSGSGTLSRKILLKVRRLWVYNTITVMQINYHDGVCPEERALINYQAKLTADHQPPDNVIELWPDFKDRTGQVICSMGSQCAYTGGCKEQAMIRSDLCEKHYTHEVGPPCRAFRFCGNSTQASDGVLCMMHWNIAYTSCKTPYCHYRSKDIGEFCHACEPMDSTAQFSISYNQVFKTRLTQES